MAVGEGGDVAGGGAGEVVDADADQLPAGLGDLLGGLPDQGERGAVVIEPAQVGDEVGAQLEAERAGQVPGSERSAIQQVDHPLPCLHPAAQLGGLGRLGR